MSTNISVAKITKNLNILRGYTVMNLKVTTSGFRISLNAPDGKEVTLTPANILGIKLQDRKTAVVLESLVTAKHQDSCEQLTAEPNHVVGCIIYNVNVYGQMNGTFSNRITISFQLRIVGTKQTPAMIATMDLSSDYKIVN